MDDSVCMRWHFMWNLDFNMSSFTVAMSCMYRWITYVSTGVLLSRTGIRNHWQAWAHMRGGTGGNFFRGAIFGELGRCFEKSRSDRFARLSSFFGWLCWNHVAGVLLRMLQVYFLWHVQIFCTKCGKWMEIVDRGVRCSFGCNHLATEGAWSRAYFEVRSSMGPCEKTWWYLLALQFLIIWWKNMCSKNGWNLFLGIQNVSGQLERCHWFSHSHREQSFKNGQ
jgi:hypothetical protein